MTISSPVRCTRRTASYAPQVSTNEPVLEVTIADETVVLEPARIEGLTFGRGAELDLDSNPFMHRRVGRFVFADGIWWIENLNAWTPITVVADGSSTLLTGQTRVALVHPTTRVRFEAGACNYELRATLGAVPQLPPTPTVALELTATVRPSDLELTDEQRLLVVALAELRLRNPAERFRLPTNRSVAARLGWTTAKFNRKLDYLCQRLERAGVAGLRSTGRRANERRMRVVDHLISNGTVSERDLELLDAYDACREKGDGDGRS